MAIEDEILANTVEILDLLRKQGFRREKVTNEALQKQLQVNTNEIREIKREIKRDRAPGVTNGSR